MFLKFRESPAFAWMIFSLSLTWFIVSYLLGRIDLHDTTGLFNTALSVEASIAACWILKLGNQQQVQLVTLVQQLLELTRQQGKLIEELTRDVDVLQEELNDE